MFIKFHKIPRFSRLSALLIILLILFSPPKVHSQGRDRSKFRITGDTTQISIDTTRKIDTLITHEPVDSTARIKYFTYERKAELTSFFGKYKHPLLLYNSSRIEYRITFDTLNNVEISEKFDGEDINVPVKIPFDEYVKKRTKLSQQEQFYKIVADFYKVSTEDELEKIFKSITDISIPLPFATETIFGPNTFNLKLNGLIDITGSYQRSSSDQVTVFQENQTQNNINFKQEVQVSTKGSVGDKLTIDADWNSQRTFEFENQLKLKYKGYADEVIQSIEAGNVSLETKSNLIGSTQALFGVKGQFKLGPLSLTALASQKKSERKEVNITGGTQETEFEISIIDYSENHYFVDTSYKPVYEALYTSHLGDPTKTLSDIQVWAQTTPSNPNKRKAIGIVELEIRPDSGYAHDSAHYNETEIPGRKMSGWFYKLDENKGEYTVDKEAGYITINVNTSSLTEDAIAVAYRRNSSTEQYGDWENQANPNDPLILKIARYKQLRPPRPPTDTVMNVAWELQLRNMYSLGVRNVKDDPSALKFSIYKKPPGADPLDRYTDTGRAQGKLYLYLTGLDKSQNGKPGTGPDNEFDFIDGWTINRSTGEIIFPTLKPFSKTLIEAGVRADSLEKNDTIYTGTKNDARSSSIKFVLKGKVVGETSSRYNLGFNIVEGSVKVFNGSVLLTEGVDYTVDYTSGELIIRNAAALVAGQNLKITYETNDLFQLASKTLLGTRAELTINKNSYIGFTLLNLKQQTLNDKVRIGEEPTNNTILGFDASTDFKANFLTKLLNKIPGYNTKEESTVNLKGEVAFMLPDPNTKKSKIPSDNGESVAYIDDFEGSKKVIPLGLNPLSWTVSSIPLDSLIVPSYSNSTERDSLMSLRRSKLNWYSLPNTVPIKEVYPNKQIASNQNQNLTPFVIDVKPSIKGMFNYITNSMFSLNQPVAKNWCGIFKYLNTTSTNLVDENINYIEVWMKVEGNPGDSAKMIIDIGKITEKVITSPLFPPKKINGVPTDVHTEDLNNNGVLDENEDVGLDGYNDDEEKAIIRAYYGGDSLGTKDPAGDNFDWTQESQDYNKFNGTEGNARLQEGRKIDTEDLNGDGVRNEINSYFEYEMPLDSNAINPFKTGGGNAGWHQYIIPLDEYKRLFGSAVFTDVQYARIWFKGFSSDTTRIKIVDMSLVGNQWVKSNKNDTTYTVGVVNIEDNSDIYNLPDPSVRQKDQTQPEQNILLNEQSLSINASNVLPGQGKFVFKTFNTKPLDLINYKIIKMFVNGDSSFKYLDTSHYDAAVVVRLGSDTANYYEYRAPIHPDVRPSTPWNPFNEVAINLSELTAIKQIRDSIGVKQYESVINGQPGAKYGIIGNPTIRTITQIVIGFENNKSNPIYNEPISGSVWFNELRVLKTNDKGGYAYNINASLKLADFANLNFAYSKVDPNFHNLEGRFGSLNMSNRWELSGTINAHKIINSLLASFVSLKLKDFLTLPITFSHSENYDKPLYVPSTDVEIETAIQNVIHKTANESLAGQVRLASQTLTITNNFSINGMKFNYPGDNFFIKEILNKFELSFYRNSTTERSPTNESNYAWEMGGNIGINSNLKLMDKLHLNIGKMIPLGDEFKDAKLYFFFPFIPLAPFYTQNLNVGASFVRRQGNSKLRTLLIANPTTRNFNADRNFTMDWKFIENWMVDLTGTYSFAAGSDLTFLETSRDSLQRSGGQILKDLFFTNGLIWFGKDLSYSQVVSINPKFNIPGIRNFIDLTSTYRVQYNWQKNPFNVALGNTVGYTADLQASALLKLNKVFELFKSGQSGPGSGAQSDTTKQSFGDLLKLLGTFIPAQINLTFSQSKNLTNPGVAGRPGFGNFWMFLNAKENYGPSRLYQLGWASDPGPRVPNILINDAQNLANNINITTFINPIFPDNLKLSFTFKESWSKNKTFTYNTNELGELGNPTTFIQQRIVSRPSFFVGGDLIQKLAKPDTLDPEVRSALIAKSFEDNVVSFVFPTWNLSLTGVEKFELFSNIANSVTIESGYNSEYKKVYNLNPGKPEYIEAQTLSTGFSPLLGFNISFKPIEEGNLTASFKLNKTNNYDVNPATPVVNNTATTDLSINASYSKTGFKVPLFGLSLSNDLTIAFSYTRTKNDPSQLRYNTFYGIWESNSLSGSYTTLLNPSIQYALSKSVTMQLFYKYTKTGPTEGNINIPTRTNNEAGLNLKLAIQ